MSPTPIRRAIIVGYLVALAIISFFVIYTYMNMREGEEYDRILNSTTNSLRVIEKVFDDVQSMESGQRGYVVSGDIRYLEPFRNGHENIIRDSLELLELKNLSTERQKDIRQLMHLVERKIHFTDTVVQLMRTKGHAKAQEKVLSQEGRLLMEQIIAIKGKLEQEDRVILSDYSMRHESNASKTSILFFTLAGLFLLSLISFYLIVRRDIQKRIWPEMATEVKVRTDRFKNILDRISDGFIALDRDWRYVYLNESAAATIGNTVSRVIGQNFWQLHSLDKKHIIYETYHQAMASQKPAMLESYYDQNDHWYRQHIYPSADGLSIHYRDITDEKKIISALEGVTQRFNLVAKATNDILWEVNLEEKTIWWSDFFYIKFGYVAEEVDHSDRAWEIYLHPDDKERVLESALNALNDPLQKIWTDQYRFAKADGSYLVIYDRCYIVRDESGKATRMIGSMTDLTSLFSARHELQITEERYKSLVDSIDGIVWEANAATFVFNFVSKQAERLLGYPVEDWYVPGFWVEHIHPDDRERTVNYCLNSTRLNQAHEFEYRMIAADGRVIWLHDFVSVKVEEGKAVLLSGVMVNITTKRQADEALGASEEKYRMLVEQATDGIFIADATGKFIVVNSSGIKMSQYSMEELKNMTIYDLADKEDLQKNPFHFEEMKSEHGARTERKLKKKDGSVIDIEVNAKFLSDGRFLAFIRDITERKKTEQVIVTSEATLRAIMDAALDAIICCDLYGAITVWSSQAEKIFGWKREEVIGKKLTNLIIPVQYRERHEVGMKHYMATGEGPVLNRLVEVTALNKDGKEFPVELSIVPVIREENSFFCAFMRDITERKQVELEIRKSNERFELIARTTNEALWEWDFETAVQWANNTHQHLYGLGPGDPIPEIEKWRERIHPEERQSVLDSFDKALTSHENIWIAEYRFLDQNKGWINIFDRTYILRDGDGKPMRMMGSMTDISERKQAELEIKKSKDLADRLIDSLPGVFYFYDNEGRFIRWNTEFELVTGYSGMEIAGMHPTQFFPPDHQEYISQRIKTVFEKGMNTAEADFITKSGIRIPYYFKAVLIQYEGKACLLGSGIDMSDKRRAEEELRVSEKNYRTLVEQAADAIIIFDGELIVDVNSVAEQISGYSREELLSMTLPKIMVKEDLEKTPIQYKELDEGASLIKRRIFKRKDGIIVTVEVHTKKLPDGRYLSIIRDLTERIKTEEQLEKSFSEIRELTDHIQNVREEERTHIAREIHDELGQQLTVLKMDVSWLNKKITNDEEDVKKKLKTLTEMLDGTVKTVRRISSELRPSLLDDLGLIATMDWHLKEFESRSGIKTEFIEPEDIDILLPEAVKTGLFRIFQESLTNVARHAEAQKVKVCLQHKKDKFVLSIEDDGIGFDEDKTAGKRTLGIRGMKERTSMMGGTYETHSVMGKGTKVVVSVPLKI